ncbi:sensor histidine kinase [Microlunatus sp. Y2014]|uniref:sensor histidine kinase n=1 Tax=Microlunatus sp. Y2014 TaxID=3418488 RepID=UPI003DA76198
MTNAVPTVAPLPELDPLHPPGPWWVINSVFAVFLLLGALLWSGTAGPWAIWGDLLLCAAVAPRMHRPWLSLALAALGGCILLLVTGGPTFGLVAVPIVTYSVARWGGHHVARALWVVMAFASFAAPIRWYWGVLLGSSSFAAFAMFVMCAMVVVSAYAVGRARRSILVTRAERLHADRERERHQLVEREQALRMSAVAERTRIARELHDIVAHSLAVITVQADGGRAMAATKPELAADVLGTIAETSRSSLAEMRSMVRLLRGEGEESGDFVPAPGLDDLPELVSRTPNATLYTEGPVPLVGESLGLTTYRVVQESLTNVLKHAGPTARANVFLTYQPELIMVEVTDDGRGAATPPDGQGNGIRGMRERVDLHGGTLDARPRIGGGFVVRATLPYGAGDQEER